MRPIDPPGRRAPFAAYSHAVLAPVSRLLAVSGQLGICSDDAVPEGAEAQAGICFASIEAILREAEMEPHHVLRLNAYVTDRAHMAGYMHARDRFIAGLAVPPASTLMIVSGFTRPEFVVEVEALAGM